MSRTVRDEGKSEREDHQQTKLIFTRRDDSVHTGVELPWRGSISIVAIQTKFFDSILAMAELSKPEELPKILQASHQAGIPSIWNRARPSSLENAAAALLTALAFCRRDQRIPLIRRFFKEYGLKTGLRGRPRLHPRESKAMVRGIQIDKLIERLSNGFLAKAARKQAGGFESGDEQILSELETLGYDGRERGAILKGTTVQDAAFHLYDATVGKLENVTLKAIQNSYAAYKRLGSNASHREINTRTRRHS